MVEFNKCAYQHDPSICQAHKIGLDQSLTDMEKANAIQDLVRVEGNDSIL